MGEGPAVPGLEGRGPDRLEHLDLPAPPRIIPGIPIGFPFCREAPRGAVGAQDAELFVALADDQAAALELRLAPGPPPAFHPELAARASPDVIEEDEILALFPDDVPQPIGAVEAAAHCPGHARRQEVRREFQRGERRRFRLGAVPGDDDAVVIAGREVDIVQVEEPDPVLPGQPDDRVPVLVAVGEGRRPVEEEVLVGGVEITPERHLVEVGSPRLGDEARLFRAAGRPAESEFVERHRMDPQEAGGRGRRRLDGIFAVEEIVQLEPGIVREPFIDPMELAVTFRRGGDLEVLFGHAPRQAGEAVVVAAHISEAGTVPAVVGRRHEEVGELPEMGRREIVLVALEGLVEQGMIRRQVNVAENEVGPVAEPGVVVAVHGRDLSAHRRLELGPQMLEAGHPVFFMVIPVRAKQVERQERGVVLADLAGRHDIAAEVREVSVAVEDAPVVPEELLDDGAVAGPESRVPVEETPDEEEPPEVEIKCRPGLGNPLAAFPGPLIERAAAGPEIAGPGGVAGQVISEAPEKDIAIGREADELARDGRQGLVDVLGRPGERQAGFEPAERRDRPGSRPEKPQEFRERRRAVLVAAEADDDDIFFAVPGGDRRGDEDAARPGKIGVGESQPAEIQPAGPAVVLEAPGDDQVPRPHFGFLDFALGLDLDPAAADGPQLLLQPGRILHQARRQDHEDGAGLERDRERGPIDFSGK